MIRGFLFLRAFSVLQVVSFSILVDLLLIVVLSVVFSVVLLSFSVLALSDILSDIYIE